ncbi:unnamed protein product [Cuscuta epithymum]|uniref:Ubiquitin-like protease family profile domain-containing protein n=1 Tax=Cuscuta epithymum TaxID=186058 RepID=A0AAV0F917_9ASTE|nr:unnamed protein product [Cuscuta epithymum]
MMALEEATMKEVRKRKRLPSKYICSPFIAPAAKRPKVFMPLHNDGKHWVLSEIDLVNRIVRVYDSMKTRRLVGSVRLLCLRLPHLFRVIKCNPALSATANSKPWKAEAVDDVPQQHPGSGVCGVMVMAFAEALLQKLPLLPECAYENMAAKRCEFAMRLWSLRKRSI